MRIPAEHKSPLVYTDCLSRLSAFSVSSLRIYIESYIELAEARANCIASVPISARERPLFR